MIAPANAYDEFIDMHADGPDVIFDERRKTPRMQVQLPGIVVFEDQAASACVIRDINYRGARIKVFTKNALPKVFDLFIPKKDLHRQVRVIWRLDGEAGVQFCR
ncbi:MAG: PilZ domain-containing protein [Pseudomonadota bacterium]